MAGMDQDQVPQIKPVGKTPRSIWAVTLLIVVLIVVDLAVMSWAGGRYRSDGVDYVGRASLPVWFVLFVGLIWKYRGRAIPQILLSVIVLLVGWGLISLFNFTRASAISAMCCSNLKQIGEALQMYYKEHGSFPPAYVADALGMPMHSWRLLILPYMDREDFYNQYDLKEPWDGPHNRRLSETPLGFFRCPWDRTMYDSATTSYLAVVGPNTAWPGTTGSKLEDFKNGPENTILVVEVTDSDIPWAMPHDLHVGQMPELPGPPGPSSPHPQHGFWRSLPTARFDTFAGTSTLRPIGRS